ncbi:ATP-binding protein [Krasilnikovia sp. MM14-A1004]|uniref:ATP-binding protein n=1 Tax=Krasilnikovia sp. MM14-A1004 TaxID=3373541 RepID=UPI00399D3DC4
MTSLRISPLPPDATELDLWILVTATQLREFRAHLIAALNGHTPAANSQLADIPERMVLVATELATNAIKHGLPPTIVRLLRTEREFVLDVADHDLTTVPELTEAGPIDTGGRGLHLARAFALDLGWYAADRTKHIWAAFPIDVGADASQESIVSGHRHIPRSGA